MDIFRFTCINHYHFIYFFIGKKDIQTSTEITEKYFKELKASKKSLFLFQKSGHQIHHDEPEKFQNTIIQTLETKKLEE